MRRVQAAIVIVSAMFCQGADYMRIPIKKKGAGPLFQIHYGDKWGFMDRTGKIVIPPRFQGAVEFRERLGRIKVWDHAECENRKYTKDDAPFEAFNLYYPDAGDCVAVHGKIGFVARNGTLAIAPRYSWAEDFSEGLATVRLDESPQTKFGFVDKTGKIVIPARFDIAFPSPKVSRALPWRFAVTMVVAQSENSVASTNRARL